MGADTMETEIAKLREHVFAKDGLPASNCSRCGIYYKQSHIIDCFTHQRMRKLDELLRAAGLIADTVTGLSRANCNDRWLVKTDDVFRLRELLDNYLRFDTSNLATDAVSSAKETPMGRIIVWALLSILVVAVILFVAYGVMVATAVSASLIAVLGILNRSYSKKLLRQGDGD